MQKIKVSVPGSIMLMGEHSVLFGHKALACAVDKRINVTLSALPGREVRVDSALASYQSDLDHLSDEPKLSFVISAVKLFAARAPSGFEIKIRSEFSHKVGLGSSAAVTAGVVAALSAFVGDDLTPEHLFDRSLSVVHQVQDGRGSGTDLVASIFGSVVSYRVAPREIKRINSLPEISLYYAGYKTKTPDVLKKVEQLSRSNPDIYEQIYQLMGKVTELAEIAIQKQNWTNLGALMNNYQGLMDALGVSDKSISDMVYSLRQSDRIQGVKISGSGLGDCVLALGNDENISIPYEQIPVAVSEDGVIIEYN
ncbi:mevalonate kinase [Neptuniibacter sp.]|uniref:mevalonate kinase n=1 Tax=Neptuniibacter sp. TaxID=1962643 RepID=UPI003B5BDD08